MSTFKLFVGLLPACLSIYLSSGGAALAQATRTWVSGVGDDANPCSRTAPCKTFAGAISKTTAGGEINALDPGGFGALTITKSITIDGGGGQVASVLVAGTNGIVVSAGASDVVTLRNLRMDGLRHTPTAGLNGVEIISGQAVHIESCNIFAFSENGILVEPSGGAPMVFVNDSVLSDNGNGAVVAPTGGVFARLLAVRTQANGNSAIGFSANGAGGTPVVELEQSQAFGNGTGLSVIGNGDAVINGSQFIDNGTGINVGTGATVFSYENNAIDGNGTQVVGSLTPLGLR
jgi:hypothetical protein